MRYEVKKPGGQRLWFVVDSRNAAVVEKRRTKVEAERAMRMWNGNEQEKLRELFSLKGLRLVAS